MHCNLASYEIRSVKLSIIVCNLSACFFVVFFLIEECLFFPQKIPMYLSSEINSFEIIMVKPSLKVPC